MNNTIDTTPTWETAVKIYIAVLENENASAQSKHNARADLAYLAKTLDRLQARSPEHYTNAIYKED